jgi:hypothetical protein
MTVEPIERLRACQEYWTKSASFLGGRRPIPMAQDKCRSYEAGPIKIVLEDRRLTPELLKSHNAKLGMDIPDLPADELDDGGLSFHVVEAGSEVEFLRFDCFEHGPHYHYLVPGVDGTPTLRFDRIANGDMVPWAVGVMRDRMRELLEGAGAFDLAAEIDDEKLQMAITRLKSDLQKHK